MREQATDVDVTFRRLTDDDLPMLHRWLNEPGVVRWWEGEPRTWEAVVEHYGSANDEPTEHWISIVEGRDVGWIQCYALADYADRPDDEEGREWVAACWALGIERTAAGIDYLIGDPADRGHGVGSAIIRAFVDDVVFGRHPTWTQACADPHVDNPSSWGALASAGFRFVGITHGRHGPGRLMALDRTIRS
jgi:aminoglycoside 6'-N-acetyltransferase